MIHQDEPSHQIAALPARQGGGAGLPSVMLPAGEVSFRDPALAPAGQAVARRMPQPGDIVTVDFEASCLPSRGRSFPIEIGLAENGASARSWLIRPHADWAGWDWLGEAEQLHGISRARLEEDGMPAEKVAAEVLAFIDGRRLVADSNVDRYWMGVLMDAAGQPAPPMLHIATLLDEIAPDSASIREAQITLATQPFRRHRAGEDARWLAALIEHITQEQGRRAAA